MKKSAKKLLFILLVTLGLVCNTFAQAPEGIIYQAEARDGKNNLITNKTLDVKITIIQDNATGSVVYEELHQVITSNNGLFVLVIGEGTNTQGLFENVDWGNHPHFLNVQVKEVKKNAWINMGTTQLLSVPYALHAKTAEAVMGTITEIDPEFNAWDKSNGISITESQISDLNHFTTDDETDPAVAANFDFTDAANGDLLQFDGTKWVKVTPDYISDYTVTETDVTAHEAALTVTESQISDLQAYLSSETDPTVAANFDFTDAANGDLLQFDGTKWVKVTPDYISDYTVTKTDVTAHEAALTVTESQISDLQAYLTSETDPAVAANFDFTDAANGDLLQFNGTKWVKVTPGYLTSYTETDPEFTAWDKSTGISVTESQISDLDHFTTADETDPTFTSSQAANITATDISNLGNLSGTNTGDQNLSTLALKTNVLELDNTTVFTPDADYEPATKKYVDDNAGGGSTTYSVGDFAQGGIIFWVDETGQHGLVAAKVDQDGGSGIQWCNGFYTDTEAHGDGVYAGEMNTMLIIANQGSNSNDYAAGVCANYTVTESGVTYGDWYLPSKDELNKMYQNKATIDAAAATNGGSGFASAYYWSSPENNNTTAWIQYFSNGSQSYNRKDDTGRVRAVRAF